MTSKMTAYPSNTRMQSPVRVNTSGWSPAIDRLLSEDYSFIPCKYSERGVLFRGMSSGFCRSLKQNEFGCYADDKPHAQLEEELGVLFLSHDLSDALTCSRLWEEVNDAGILVVGTDVFNSAYADHFAAMMSFAEPGVVFKYPMLCNNIMLEQVRYIFINQHTQLRLLQEEPDLDLDRSRLIVLTETGRASIERAMTDFLNMHQLEKAIPVSADICPRRNS